MYFYRAGVFLPFFVAMSTYAKKYQSLKSKKAIAEVLSKGQKLKDGSLLMFCLPSEENGIKVAFSVKKKDHKKAVSRNKIKRMMREAFRLNQTLILEQNVEIFIMHLGSDIEDFHYFNQKIKQLLERLVKEQNQNHEV